MNRKQTSWAIGTALSAVVLGTYYWQSLLQDMYARFPDIDRKVVRKAFRRFVLESLRGKYQGLDFDDDAAVTHEFLCWAVHYDQKK